jgi:hypothetical protein
MGEIENGRAAFSKCCENPNGGGFGAKFENLREFVL